MVVDKPAGITSHGVVARARRALGTRKIGHAGTLDPMATGVLVLGVGRGTKLLTYLVGADKTYRATIRLGVATVTDDREGDELSRTDASATPDDAVRRGVRALIGEIEQVPSAVSAIKVDGRRAYDLVRAGEEVTLAARRVTVHRFDVLDLRRDEGTIDVDVEVDCSSGTYVRALARDLGAALGVGGHLTALRRTRVGAFGESDAAPLDTLTPASVTGLAAAARELFPAREVTAEEARRLVRGQRLPSVGAAARSAAFAPDGTLVALVEDDGTTCRPVLGFAP